MFERLESTDSRVRKLEESVSKLQEGFLWIMDNNAKDLGLLNSKIVTVETRVNEMFNELMETIQEIRKEIQEIKNELTEYKRVKTKYLRQF